MRKNWAHVSTASGSYGRLAGRLAGWLAGRLAGWLADEMGVDFEILKILYRLNYSDVYFVWYCYNVIIVLSMHFNWFFSAKANFKVCIAAQKISVAIFFHVNPYY